MKKNLTDYKKLNIWKLINLFFEKKTINENWIYFIKLKKINKKHEKKIQWITKKFQRQYGIDYFEIFVHMAKFIFFVYCSFLQFISDGLFFNEI